MNEVAWKKYTDEKILVSRDWTIDLDGATLVGVPTATVYGDDTLTCTYIETSNNENKFWLEGGDATIIGQYVHLRIATNEGEILSDNIAVQVRPI